MLFCNSFLGVIIVFALTLPLIGCSGFFAVPFDGMGVLSENVTPGSSDVDVRQLSRQSTLTHDPTTDVPFVSGTPPSDGPVIFAGQSGGGRSVVAQSEINYENATLSEDVTWRGSVLVRGYLVIAPQATVRIAPGTVVRFMKSPIISQTPRLVVMGRLYCGGTTERPILFVPNTVESTPGDWGGILLLSSEKHNQFNHIRIEGATIGIDARFSTLAVTESAITRSSIGILLRDSVARLTSVAVDACDTGLDAFDSEVDLRNGAFTHNRQGIVARRTTLVLQAMSVKNSGYQGISADECRIRFNSCDLTGNMGGVRLARAEGRIIGSRFVGNRGAALFLESSRLKIHRSLFADTLGDGIHMDDGQSVIWESAFDGNSGYNLVNSGLESVSAVRNWWGSNNEMAISEKLFKAEKGSGAGQILFFPWLLEKPVAAP